MEYIAFPKGKATDKEFYYVVGETREKIKQLKEGVKFIIFDKEGGMELNRLGRLSTGFIRRRWNHDYWYWQ